MTNKITVFFGIAVMTAVLVGGLTYTQLASATVGNMFCSTDKDNPTIGDLSTYVIVIETAGDDCYLGQYGEFTHVYGIDIDDAGTVNVVNTEIDYAATYISGTTEKLKFKDNELHTHAFLFSNDVTHFEVMDNYVVTGYDDPQIFVDGNTVNLLKIVGNSVDISMKANTIDFFAFCKNNTPDVHSWDENTYNGKNKGCPTSDL